MVERDVRGTTHHHHHRPDGNIPHDAHHGDGDSHVSEPARRGGKRVHHEKEESQRKERGTRMSKRTEKVISSVAAFIAFVFAMSAGVYAGEARQLRPTDRSVADRPEVFPTDFGRNFRERRELRESERGRGRFERDFERDLVFAVRDWERNDARSFRERAFQLREFRFDDGFVRRPFFAERRDDGDRPYERLESRRTERRAEFRPDAEREARAERVTRFAGEFDFERGREARAA